MSTASIQLPPGAKLVGDDAMHLPPGARLVSENPPQTTAGAMGREWALGVGGGFGIPETQTPLTSLGEGLKETFAPPKGVGEALVGPLLPVARIARGLVQQQVDVHKDIYKGFQEKDYPRIAHGIGTETGLMLNALLFGRSPAKAEAGAVEGKIAGVETPTTVGMRTQGALGDFLRTTESYLKRMPMSQPLRRAAEAQAQAVHGVLKQLSGVPEVGGPVQRNFAAAREATRRAADPIYESLADAPVPDTVGVAASIVGNEKFRPLLSSDTKVGLTRLSEGGEQAAMGDINGVAKRLGYKSYADAIAQVGKEQFQRFLPPDMVEQLSGAQTTFKEAHEARSALANDAFNATNLADKRLLNGALDQFDSALARGLTPEQVTTLQQAHRMTERSYVQESIYNALRKDMASQPPEAGKVRAGSLNRLVNQLSEPRKGLSGERTKLDVLYDNPTDKAAWRKLAQYTTQTQGKAAYASLIGKSVIFYPVLHTVYDIVTSGGAHVPAILGTMGADLGAIWLTSKVLASPGGPSSILGYIKSAGAPARQAAFATRIATLASGQPTQSPPTSPSGREARRLGLNLPEGMNPRTVETFINSPRYKDWDDEQRRMELKKLFASGGQ